MNLTLTNLHPSLRPPALEWRRAIRRLISIVKGAPKRYPNFRIMRLDVAWLDDARMAEANWRHLRHQGSTDILTFDYGDGRAEILISLDTAERQAKQHRQTFRRELTLYLAHGILHLAGVGDKSSSQRRHMRREEKWLIQSLRKRRD